MTLSIISGQKQILMAQTNQHLSFKYVEFALKRNHFCNWRCSFISYNPWISLWRFWHTRNRGTNNSDNAGGKPTRGFSLQHETFSALNYAQDFGATVRESLKRTTNSKWATLTKSRIVPCQILLCLCHHSQLSLPLLQTWSCDVGLDRELPTFLTTNYKRRIKSR